ncbi:death domain-containing protein CRADD-like [Glandiceps talaboti]
MEEKHKKALTSKWVDLISHIEVKYLLPQLQQDGILTTSMAEDILAATTSRERARNLLHMLPTRGPNAFSSFVIALGKYYPWLKNELVAECGDVGSQVGRVVEKLPTPIKCTDESDASEGDGAASDRESLITVSGAAASANSSSGIDSHLGGITSRLSQLSMTQGIDRRVTEQNLLTVAEKMGEEWEGVAIKLGFQSNDVFRFKEENSTVNGKIFAMLLKWKRRRGHDATAENLCKELKDADVDLDVYKHLW